MNSFITLIFALVIGVTAQAQNLDPVVKVKTITTDIVVPDAKQEMRIKTENGISVIYIFKNAKVKRALSFIAPHNKTRLV